MASEVVKPDSDSTSEQLLDISVGILTYQRPESLWVTLKSLLAAEAIGPPAFDGGRGWRVIEVLVIDNDALASAADMTSAFAAQLRTEHGIGPVVRHIHEPEPGLAAARNRALSEAHTGILVFIDDDEKAEPGWPDGLIQMMRATGAAMVGGPVLTSFDHEPPEWAVVGGYFDRRDPPHGDAVPWLRSGNLAIDLVQIREVGLRFDPRFGLSGGEDVAFSRAAVGKGLTLRWSAHGAVTESVGSDRTTVRWVTNRWRRGSASFVRAHLATDSTARRRMMTALRGCGRLGRGGATVLWGAATLNYPELIKGVAEVHRGFGYLEGLFGRPGTTYGARQSE